MSPKREAYQYKVPYDKYGLMHYPTVDVDYSPVKHIHACQEHGIRDCTGLTWHYQRAEGEPIRTPPEWRDNAPFYAKLSMQEMQTGRSAKFIWWESDEGLRYPMFVADLMELCKQGEVIRGVALGQWRVRKRGQNYGVIPWLL